MQTNPVKAIREKCLDCSGGSAKEAELCPVTRCALHPFRFGKNPYRTPRTLTEEQREAQRERIRKARSFRNSLSGDQEKSDNSRSEGKFTSEGETPPESACQTAGAGKEKAPCITAKQSTIQEA